MCFVRFEAEISCVFNSYTAVNIGDEGHLISTYFQANKRGYISCVE
jgi:hypothetical protein